MAETCHPVSCVCAAQCQDQHTKQVILHNTFILKLVGYYFTALDLGGKVVHVLTNGQGGGRTTAMLPGLRSDLLARPSASSSAAVRPSKFPLASFCHLPLRLSCPHVLRQPAFFPSSTSSSRPPSSLLLPPPPVRLSPVLSCIAVAARVVSFCPIILGPAPAPSVAVVCDKSDSKSEKKKREE